MVLLHPLPLALRQDRQVMEIQLVAAEFLRGVRVAGFGEGDELGHGGGGLETGGRWIAVRENGMTGYHMR